MAFAICELAPWRKNLSPRQRLSSAHTDPSCQRSTCQILLSQRSCLLLFIDRLGSHRSVQDVWHWVHLPILQRLLGNRSSASVHSLRRCQIRRSSKLDRSHSPRARYARSHGLAAAGDSVVIFDLGNSRVGFQSLYQEEIPRLVAAVQLRHCSCSRCRTDHLDNCHLLRHCKPDFKFINDTTRGYLGCGSRRCTCRGR